LGVLKIKRISQKEVDTYLAMHCPTVNQQMMELYSRTMYFNYEMATGGLTQQLFDLIESNRKIWPQASNSLPPTLS